MRSDVHASALRSAAKVAFSVAFLGGCSAAPAVTAGEEPPGDPDEVEPVTTESELGAKKPKTKTKRPAPTSCPSKQPPTASCASVVAAAFPTEGEYPGVKQAVSSDVQACCVQLLDESQGALANHRWDCCANLPEVAPPSVGIACTPWGPPVPPAMKARARRVRTVA